MRKVLIPAVAALALSACATPTTYQPATGSSGVGFSEQQIEADRWRVTFHGGSGGSAAQVNDYAVLRAAELTLAQGYDWFQVVSRYTDAAGGYYNGYGSGVSVGAGGGDWGGGSFGGAGIGLSFPLGGSGPALTTTLDVRLGRGARPQSPDAYDARDVVSSLRGR